MIDDMNILTRLAEFPHITELIVSRKLLLNLLHLKEITEIRLNMAQESQRFPFVHSLRWRGKLFIHLSMQRIRQPIQRTPVYAEC
jgi:hypothetical protein